MVRKRNTPRITPPHIVTPGQVAFPSHQESLFVPSHFARKRDGIERKRDGIERKRDGIERKRDGMDVYGRKR